ncbi:MAG: hypothetical protein H6667_18000 [Ardenticatenaceae bacterium]|nr:hypothetical protein [Ardenticatenaceae bacterium]
MNAGIEDQEGYRQQARTQRLCLLLSSLLLLLAIWCFNVYYEHQTTPRLIIDTSVAPDFAVVIQETWEQFMSAFAARSDCFGDVLIKADYDMPDRAMYDPRTATITVRVPERASKLKGALVHEWAHHVEFQCEAHTELREAFIEAQGMPANTPWRSEGGSVNVLSSDWANIPSEQYAETTIVLVLGKRPVKTNAPITEDGVDVIRAWAQKGNSFLLRFSFWLHKLKGGLMN